MAHIDSERTQRFYARMAGFLFLWLIVTGVTGMLMMSQITGSGTFMEASRRVAASERWYRVALCFEMIETLSALLLAFALYVTLKSANKVLSQLGMYWRLAESFIGSVGVLLGYMKLRVYLSPHSLSAPDQSQALLDILRHAGVAAYNMGALCFSIGSLLFFYVFLKSRYIPTILSSFGIFASIIVTILCFGSLLFPEYSSKLQYGWAPMAIAEVGTGIWLMVFAVKPQASVAS